MEALRGHRSGELTTVCVKYFAHGAPALTGLGLRLHYDSSALDFRGIDGVLREGLVGVSPPQPDLRNFDGDPTTDRFVLVSWADLYGQWPGSEEVQLFQVVVAVVGESRVSSTVHITASSHAAGTAFVSMPLKVDLRGGHWKRKVNRMNQVP